MKVWINAFRLRTLPLALSSIIMGIVIAFIYGYSNIRISIWAIITTILLQILSNLANDYGDGVKGTDNEKRLGPKRTIQSGVISKEQMKSAIIIFSILSLLSGSYLILISKLDFNDMIVFFSLGIFAIISAIHYTVGKKAYGYSGFGDVFVFIFFGLVAVLGTFYLISGKFKWDVLLPASTIGFLSTAVLNLNNIRDFENDKVMGKNTIAVRLGVKRTKLYHIVLINFAFLFLLFFISNNNLRWYYYLPFLIYPFFIMDLMEIDKENDLQKIDPYLKKTAIKTFLFVLIFLVIALVGDYL